MFKSLLLTGLVALLIAPTSLAQSPSSERMWVFIGTYTGKKSEGIYRVELDPATGKLGQPELAAKVTSPSFLAISPDRTRLFCVGEIDNFNGKKAGGVSSFSLDAKTGDLKLINQQSSVGAGPCHIVCDKTGKNVLVANYAGGSAAVLPVDKDGKLGEASCFIQHKGSSVDKDRQEGPHAHSVNLDAANKFAVVADLGLDKVLVYKFDSAAGKIAANDPAAVDLAPGDGPRHFAFHPNGKFAYVNNEMTSSLTAMTYSAAKGKFTKLNTLSTLPAPHKGNSTAETVVHPNGKFVYTSNRGHNSIAIFAIDQSTGEIKALGHQGEGVKIPRNFNIDPTGKWMVVANQDGDSIIVYAIDDKTGKLTPTGQKAEVGSPVCVKFVSKP
jgi:6-phosphogluconolactonase